MCTYLLRLFTPIHPSRLLESLAKRSADVGQNGDDFQRNCVSQASEYQINLLGLERLLAQLGANKGLANYDRNNDVQVILKRTVNLNKDTLSALAAIIDNIPGLGPLLGPSKLFTSTRTLLTLPFSCL